MNTIRIGFYNYGMVEPIVGTRTESGAEHMYGCMTLLLALTDLYPDLLTMKEERAMIYAMQFHDTGEPAVGGDVADNGNRDQSGQDEEAEYVRTYLQLLTERSSAPAIKLFDDFESDHQTKAGRIMLLIDKMEFFLQAVAYAMETYEGSLSSGKVFNDYEPSAHEERYQELTGSDSIIDLVAASIIDRYFNPIINTDWTDQSPGAVRGIVSIFQGLMRTAVINLRGEWFAWAAKEPFFMP